MRRGVDRLAALVRARAAVDGGDGSDGSNRPEFHLLPENVPVFRLWGRLQTQWVHGMAGPTGFSWASLRAHPAVTQLPRRRREALLQGIADMEGAWLAERGRIAAEKRHPSH